MFTICRIFNLIWFEINNPIEYVPAIIFVFEFGVPCTSSKSWKIGFLSSQYYYTIQWSWSYRLDIRGLSWWGAKKLGLWLGRVEFIRSSKRKNRPSCRGLMLVTVRQSLTSDAINIVYLVWSIDLPLVTILCLHEHPLAQ